MMKYQKDPKCGIFLKRGLFRGIKNYIPICRTRKYTNTNTQIQHMTKCQKDPTCSIFLKKRIVQGYQKLYSHVSNAQMQSKVPERPNIRYIFEKAIVQGCLLSLAQLYKVQFCTCMWQCPARVEIESSRSESGQMVSEKVKLTYFDVYLSRTM